MATWRDGAEYAPIERPDGFAAPIVDPLCEAKNSQPKTLGAVAPPDELHPADTPPLGVLSRREPHRRNPREPFQVVSAGIAQTPSPHREPRDPRLPFPSLTVPTTRGISTLPPPPPNAVPIAPSIYQQHFLPAAQGWAPPTWPPASPPLTQMPYPEKAEHWPPPIWPPRQ